MKKLILSMVILLAVVAGGIFSIRYIKNSSDKLQTSIVKASDLVSSGRWSAAADEISSVEDQWNSTEKTWAILVDHYEIDSIESSIIRSKRYIETKDAPLSMAELDNLKFSVEHIYKKELINMKNIF